MNLQVEIPELNAARAALTAKENALEAKACTLMRQYGFFLPKPAKEFFRELADHLKWQHLNKEMK